MDGLLCKKNALPNSGVAIVIHFDTANEVYVKPWTVDILGQGVGMLAKLLRSQTPRLARTFGTGVDYTAECT